MRLPTTTTVDKRQVLLEELLRASAPVSGDELAARLKVSTRMVRNYVRQINGRDQVVHASHRGYRVDRDAYARWRGRSPRRGVPDTPDKRLDFLSRDLAQRAKPVSVYDLAEVLAVSESTLEADLSRARELFRQHDLSIKRDHDLVWLEGPERSRRRLVRQMLHSTTDGLIPATWQAFVAEYDHIDIRGLRGTVDEALAESQLVVNEFAMSDLLVHLTITLDRLTAGHPLPSADWTPPTVEPTHFDLTERLAGAVARDFGVTLPEAELWALYGVVAVRTTQQSGPNAALAVDPQWRTMVAEILDDVSARYLLGPADPSMQLNLALHVQNMVARAKSGLALVNPLGEDFKRDHPLVHDLALYFAQKVEWRTGIVIKPGEVDYLSMHMGMQYMRYLDERDMITMTLVVPQYYGMADALEEKLAKRLRGQAVIEKVATTLDFDFTSVTSDLIVSCVDPSGPTSAPVEVISPFLTPHDADRVAAGVQAERDRNARRRMRTLLGRLIDPQLYFHVPLVASREDALTLMTQRLQDLGYVSDGFYHDVMDRELRSATSFGGDFALPHSMYMDANSTGISVLVAENPIPWGEGQVHLVLLFALSPDGRRTFRDVLDGITRLLSEPATTQALISSAGTFGDFMSTLMGLLDE